MLYDFRLLLSLQIAITRYPVLSEYKQDNKTQKHKTRSCKTAVEPRSIQKVLGYLVPICFQTKVGK